MAFDKTPNRQKDKTRVLSNEDLTILGGQKSSKTQLTKTGICQKDKQPVCQKEGNNAQR